MGIKVNDIAYVRFEAPDLDVMERFLADFGMVVAQRIASTLYMRGTDDDGYVHVTHQGDEARFVGLAFAADTSADLDVLAKSNEFSGVGDLDGPGGGAVVRSTDPNGFVVEVVADRESLDPLAPLSAPPGPMRNDARGRPRIGGPVRLEGGPAHVVRLGHCVLDVVDFRASEAWYKAHFGLVTSDEVELHQDRSLGAFLRCDQGERYVDHHTLFLVGIGKARFNHAAFEVTNFDDLMSGHTHLLATSHTHQWGVGRHILGSQIYDYWLDPHGHMVEHWTDGDLFNNQSPPAVATLDALLGSHWGPTSGGPPS